MLLLVDAGNTRIKWALVGALVRSLTESDVPNQAALGHWTQYGSVRKEDSRLLGDALQGIDITHVLLSNVAGETMRAQLDNMILRAVGLKPVPFEWFAARAELAGVVNNYRDPNQLGSDRFASMIGARALFPGRALLVATCGTATTVDALTAEGHFVGGMILPGLGLMAGSLARHTAQLPQVPERDSIAQLFADNTNDAIVSGCIHAQVGAIERALVTHAATQGGPVTCVLSGGAATFIAPHLSVACESVDNLVLIGLQVAAAYTSFIHKE